MAPTIFPGELIGEEIEVIHSQNHSARGRKGKIIDETKMTLVIESNGARKRLLKNSLTFKVVRSGRIIAGASILRRPEERAQRK